MKIHLSVGDQSHRAADLMVEPYWTLGTKDHLVGIAIQEDLHLRAVANTLGAIGILAISFAAWPGRPRGGPEGKP